MYSDLRINVQRLSKKLQDLAQLGSLPNGGVSRLALTSDDKLGRDQVVGWMKELGLTIRIDQIGNVIGIRKGKIDAPPVLMGSHIDTVTVAGPYDGCLGVLAGLEVIQVLNENNIETDLPIAVGFFTNEEGSRFPPDMMGSLVFVGDLPLEEALRTFGIYKANVADSLNRIGYHGKASCGDFKVHSYLELHIEQGPVLERMKKTIGIVESVQGISWTELTLKGKSCHAGYYPMDLRNDPSHAAACIMQFARTIPSQVAGNQVATVGHMEFHPNLVNVAPDKITMTVDLRNPEELELQKAEKLLFDYVEKICKDENLTYEKKSLARFIPTPFDKTLVNTIEKSANKLGYTNMRLHSTAGHDAQILARICPSAMIFVPCVDGISHNIKEFTHEKDIEAGANVLLQAALKQVKASYSKENELCLSK